MAKLVCQSGPSAGHEYPLTKEVLSMGRQSSCDVQILDTMSSRVHCQVRRDGKLFTLVDLGSRNGTHLNGKKVTERQLAFGDRIRIGEAEYILVKEPGDIELKDLLSKYEVQEKLGEGGMGIVYKAVQRSMVRTVALKILSPKYAARSRFVDQFIREARAAGALNHPNIIQVHDVGTENGIHYFSMEFVDGPTCMQVLREQGPFSVAEALEIVRQTARALDYAHSQRLIHQDIKPDNIMLGVNNIVKLADLGISKTFDEAENEEGPKRVMGTPHYMAPEAALGKKMDHRVDIYSLGATLYHLLTGKTPYVGTSATEVLKAHVMDPVPAIQDINPEVPDDVCALVERLMAKKPDDRYTAAAEVVEEVKRLQSGHKLSTDRIAASETMVLRKLARGPGGGEATPAQTGGTRGTRAGATRPGMTTENRSARRQSSGTNRLRLVFVIGLGAVIIFVAVVLMQSLGRGPRNVRPLPPPPVSGTQTPPGGVVAPAPDPGEAAARARKLEQGAELDRIGQELSVLGERGDASALLTRLDQLSPTLPAEHRVRAESLRSRIAQAIDQQRQALRDQEFTELQAEARTLADQDRNYDIALKRLADYAAKAEPAFKLRAATLAEQMGKARDAYVADLHLKVQAHVISERSPFGNAPALKLLRDQLPPAMVGSETEKQIKDELAKIEAKSQETWQVVVRESAVALAAWNLGKVDELHRAQRGAMNDSPAGKQLDIHRDAARKLAELVPALDAALRALPRPLRWRGVLQTWTDPDLIGADKSGLQLEISAGQITVPWTKLEPAALADIANQALKDQAAGYRPAIDALTAARAAAAEKK